MSSRPGGAEQVRAYASTIQRLSVAFAQRSKLDAAELDAAACDAFIDFHGKRVWPEVEVALAASLGKKLASSLLQYVKAHTDQLEPIDLLVGAVDQKYPPADLSALVLEWLISDQPNLKDGDWREIAEFAATGPYTTLLFLCNVSVRKVDHGARMAVLESMSHDTFRQLHARLESIVSPALFISPIHAGDLVGMLSDLLAGHVVVAVVEAILQAGRASVLDQLTPRIATLAPETVQALFKLIRKRADIPFGFYRALEERRDELPRSPWPW